MSIPIPPGTFPFQLPDILSRKAAVYSPSIREAIWGVYRRASSPGVRFVLMMVERRSIWRVLTIWYRRSERRMWSSRIQIVQNQQIAVHAPLHILPGGIAVIVPAELGAFKLAEHMTRRIVYHREAILADHPCDAGREEGLAQPARR